MSENPLKITSLQNDRIKALVRLRNRRERDREGVTVIEEPLVIERAFAAGYPLQTVFFCNACLGSDGENLLLRLQAAAENEPERAGLEFIELTEPVMAKVSYRDRPEGLLVVAPQTRLSLDELDLDERPDRAPLLVVLEGVEKPGNLGAVLRVADGAGVDAVIVCGGGTDLFNPNVLRASRGAFFSVPTVAADTATVMDFLRTNEIQSVASSPIADLAWNEADLTRAVAIVLGTEHEGLTTELLAGTDLAVGIPMHGAGDSLNVATAASIILYEAVRQRSTARKAGS